MGDTWQTVILLSCKNVRSNSVIVLHDSLIAATRNCSNWDGFNCLVTSHLNSVHLALTLVKKNVRLFSDIFKNIFHNYLDMFFTSFLLQRFYFSLVIMYTVHAMYLK